MGKANGLLVTSKVFKTDDEAREWLSDNTEKWESAKAVKVGDFSKSFYAKPAISKLMTSIKLLKEELDCFDEAVYIRTKAAKSQMRGCKSCGSSINVAKIKGPSFGEKSFRRLTDCPVCGSNYLITDTDKAKKSRLEDKFLAVKQKLASLEAKVDRKNEPYWYIGAWVAS